MREDERAQVLDRRRELKLYAGGDGPASACGVCFSGGGIRSATFNLGILQKLAMLGFLPAVDYLSTVSGGGYLGSWLHGVIRNKCEGEPGRAKHFLQPPEQRPHDAAHPDQDPILFLRKYSSYLAPDVGLFSADFWSILVIWTRNTFLNLLMIIPFLGVMCLLAMIAELLFSGTKNAGFGNVAEAWGAGLAVLFAVLAVLLAGKGVGHAASGAGEECDEPRPRRGGFDKPAVAVTSAALLMGASVVVALLNKNLYGDGGLLEPQWYIVFAVFSACLLTLQIVGRFWQCSKALGRSPVWAVIGCAYPFLAGAVTAFLIWLLAWWMSHWTARSVIAWGPPFVTIAFLTGAAVHIGLMGADFWDYAREWLARVGAFLSIMAFSWAAVFALAVFGPWWMASLALHYGKTASGLGAGWILTTLAGVLSANSNSTGAGQPKTKSGFALDIIARIAPTVFMAGFLVLISFAAFAGIRGMTTPPCAVTAPPSGFSMQLTAQATSGSQAKIDFTAHANAVPGWLQWLIPLQASYWCVLDASINAASSSNLGALGAAAIILAGCAILVGFVPFFVNINEFSMHHFYKNRLVRCYLGASRGDKRRPSRVTGFDSCDDFPLQQLLPTDKQRYLGPYAILNATVNLDRGSELARKERQGESFIFTPLYCGFDPPRSPQDEANTGGSSNVDVNGYHDTAKYTSPSGPGIGTCMAISGAAVNPNHGYHTSATVAFLLTIFDVRLGWWLRNSRRKTGGEKPGPSYALQPLLSELFAQTDQRARWLNVSDGGQFENLGVYELVRRRCRFIITGDGEQDANYTFESLGGAVRKCRTDFGVDIDIDPRRIRPVGSAPSETHCVVGTISYPADPAHKLEKETGWILYLKASMTGDEPEDVEQYRTSHPDFPHQSTGNQFFTESQFESYRKLGWHVAQSAFENVPVKWKEQGNAPDYLERVFRCLEQQWYASPSAPSGTASAHAAEYSKLMDRLAEPALSELAAQLFGWDAEIRITTYDFNKPEHQKIFFYCLELIQLMENVWSDLRFDRAPDRNGPRHRGWITVFRRWANQPAIIWVWSRAKHTYNPLFQQFFISMQEPANRNKRDLADIPCGPLPEPGS